MVGFPDPDPVCRRHPNHKKLPGVCSSCLREKLSKLTADHVAGESNYSTACYTSLSSSPPYSSASSFSPAVLAIPAEDPPKIRRRNGSDERVAVPLGFLLNDSNGIGDLGFKKSRSVGCGPRIYRGVNTNGDVNANGVEIDGGRKREKGGKKGGFWKKLIHSTSKKTKGVLMHSSTMKERSNHHDAISSASSRRFR